MNPIDQDAPNMEFHRKAAKVLLKAYRTNDAETIASFKAHLGSKPEKSMTLSDAQWVYAQMQGFASWTKLKEAIESKSKTDRESGKSLPTKVVSDKLRPSFSYIPQVDVPLQVYWVDAGLNLHDLGNTTNHKEFRIPTHLCWMIEPVGEMDSMQWEKVLMELRAAQIPGFVGGRFITDDHMATIGRAEHLSYLNFNTSQRLSGKGLRHLAPLSQLLSLSVALNINFYTGTLLSSSHGRCFYAPSQTSERKF